MGTRKNHIAGAPVLEIPTDLAQAKSQLERALSCGDQHLRDPFVRVADHIQARMLKPAVALPQVQVDGHIFGSFDGLGSNQPALRLQCGSEICGKKATKSFTCDCGGAPQDTLPQCDDCTVGVVERNLHAESRASENATQALNNASPQAPQTKGERYHASNHHLQQQATRPRINVRMRRRKV
jgi:hypothetical protein